MINNKNTIHFQISKFQECKIHVFRKVKYFGLNYLFLGDALGNLIYVRQLFSWTSKENSISWRQSGAMNDFNRIVASIDQTRPQWWRTSRQSKIFLKATGMSKSKFNTWAWLLWRILKVATLHQHLEIYLKEIKKTKIRNSTLWLWLDRRCLVLWNNCGLTSRGRSITNVPVV